tara:strand:- start:321 stop:494 length:174 start_codon:yes stop_codon:yes gene_type:complete
MYQKRKQNSAKSNNMLLTKSAGLVVRPAPANFNSFLLVGVGFFVLIYSNKLRKKELK